MLSTWEASYFKSPGMRVFFQAPRDWIDRRLPITLSVPARVERVMIGRIDLVTPRSRALAGQYLDLAAARSPQAPQVLTQIGRFATAIVNDETARRAALQRRSGG